MSTLRIILLCVASLVLTLGTGAALFAPQLPGLVVEGFPKSVWPAPGRFATLEGAEREVFSAGAARPLHPDFRRQFDEREGRAVLVLHEGVVAHEHYAEGFGPQTLFNSYSMVKSLTGALVLKAVAEGRIDGFDAPLGRYVPGLHPSLSGTPIRDALDMRAGLNFEAGFGAKDADDGDPFGALARLHILGLDAVKSGLRGSPGRKFKYENVNSSLLGAVLETAYGVTLPALLDEKIWRPAGAGRAYWRTHGENATATAYCCLYATVRDWAKVGLFLMKNERFLPDALKKAFFGEGLDYTAIRKGIYSLHARQDVLDRPGEPLQGRFTNFHGQDGQTLYLMPERDLIIVRFGYRSQHLHSFMYRAWRSLTGSQ